MVILSVCYLVMAPAYHYIRLHLAIGRVLHTLTLSSVANYYTLVLMTVCYLKRQLTKHISHWCYNHQYLMWFSASISYCIGRFVVGGLGVVIDRALSWRHVTMGLQLSSWLGGLDLSHSEKYRVDLRGVINRALSWWWRHVSVELQVTGLEELIWFGS